MQAHKPLKTCPVCKKEKGIRTFCRPQLQVQKVCNLCWRNATAADPKRAQNALANGTIPAPVLQRLILNKRDAMKAREKVRKSAAMKAYWAKKRVKN